MLPIIEYIKSLVPTCERSELLKAVSSLRDEHSETLMPAVREVSEMLTNFKFTSKLYKDYEVALHRHANYNQPAITLLIRSIENLQNIFPFLEKEIRANFGPQVATASMTYDSVNVLRYLDSVGFYIRYARKFILKVVADEAAQLGGTPPEMIRHEREYLENNLGNFAGLLLTMLKNDGELKQVFRKVSTAVIDETTADLAFKSLGQEKIDPMKLASFSPQQNWFMSFGKWLVEWQVARYRSGKEDLTALQMRLQEMRELLATGKASPVIQKQIQRLEARIEKLDASLAEVEDNARDDRGLETA